MKITAVDQPTAPPIELPARFRTEIVYFTADAPASSAAPGPGEYWFDHTAVRRWLDEMVLYIISPLDAKSHAEVELSEDHERFLEWLVAHDVRHVRVEAMK